jgi:ribonuclease BN (tRNA processing enzyme)
VNRLVLLGTKGGPAIRTPGRFPISNLLVIGGQPYVIDAGYGVTQRLVDAKISLISLRHIFITHLHSDHILELGPLIYTAWANGLSADITVHGPPGIEDVLSGFWVSLKFDIETRMSDEGRPDVRRMVIVDTYSEGEVFAADGVKVSALRNVHPPITESFALKFTFAGKIVVFSGDTAYFPPLADFARGADVLVHEAMYGPAMEALARRTANAGNLFAHLQASHTLVEDVGRIAQAAKVGHLVLNHLVPADDPAVSDTDWIAGIRRHFAGEVSVGRDLLELAIG